MRKVLKSCKTLAAASLALALLAPAINTVNPVQALAASATGQSPALTQSTAALTETVPFRDYAESLGAVVSWNETDRTATALRGKTSVTAAIGEAYLTVNGNKIALGESVRLVGEKTVVPLGALNEAFGVSAGWDKEAGAIISAKDDYPLLASNFIAAWNKGDLAKTKGYMSPSLQMLMPDQLLGQFWSNLAQMYGPLGQQLAVNVSSSAVHHNAAVLYKTGAAAFEVTVRFDTYGLVDDLYLSPTLPNNAYVKPSYDDPAKYSEKEVVIGEGPLALPGTLTTPAGQGPFPVVVLVHGSGPNDRDESIGAVKSFRDLAVGLAAQGIAVLRYEKVTREHPLKSQMMIPMFTVQEETVDDAIRAVELLRKTDGIDPKRIFVAGHSQGGMMIPRIMDAAQGLDLAGAIVLAGPSRPLENLIVEQMKFQTELARQAGQPTEAMEQQTAVYEQQLQLIKDPKYSLTNPPQGFMLGNTAWWLDIRNLYAGEAAKNQKVPLLIMQGGNDAQVFPDNLEGWKTALAARSDVQYKLYPSVNHTLVEYEGKSTGAEYSLPANVPDYIIADMAKWIKP
ncbi:alpha/beta fold hydrolase [Paenibacillus ginsengarvi]|uniref:Alpha/beta fold hydrolase n=1 Tax=Paenibacillus ginsengarvi TaxID=400777 RepID=A0A3B0BJ44_9BACL|nr:alpha/beta fold hydrolase [Paenibacillus ginsengarvi]RKN71837.1 alpha/beta fold hydrolase [Paenibacillus ginsengarvi]